MRPLIALLALGLAACGGATTELPPPPDPGDGTLLIGTGVGEGTQGSELEYGPLEDGAELVLEPGAQGGFHVFLHLRIDAAAVRAMGERPLVQRWARRAATGELVSRNERRHAFVPAEGAPELLELDGAVPLFLCPTPIGIPVADEPLDLEVHVSAEEGAPAVKARLRFTPRCPEDRQAEFCQNICYG